MNRELETGNGIIMMLHVSNTVGRSNTLMEVIGIH